ncbi:28S ribosomal protein S36, mitochondrial [Cephus cinctus]|uniref:28S ribosomal protein S36, mitochondrial n=1 Tax=Cephus cinctus TaxID=211228 RepID=A0AAJ7C8G4_CEPCN|nr:28S ribosomal protein S36, mitochondrial [Cephus cinctus]
MASTGWRVVQAHVPLIRFRKGGINKVSAGVIAAPSGSVSSTAQRSQGATGPNVISLPTIDDFQLPLRFKRRAIDQKEIDFINRGGPE